LSRPSQVAIDFRQGGVDARPCPHGDVRLFLLEWVALPQLLV
jgi:hypothetical protein